MTGFFIDFAVVVDSALDREEILYSFEELQEKIAEVALAASDGLPTQVYALFHDHDPLGEDEECCCVQYLQDHSPHCTFNISEEEPASQDH